MNQNATASPSNVSETDNAASQPSPRSGPSITKATRTRGDYAGICMKAYSASLLTVGVMVPVVASLIAVTLYLTLPNSPLPPLLGVPPSSPWYTLVYSSLLTGVLWLLTSFPFCSLSTAQGANPRNYSLLQSRLHQLKASLGMKDYADGGYEESSRITTLMENAGCDARNNHQWDVLKEAFACCMDICSKLYKFPAGLRWIIGTGYNSAWILLHHAEEVVIEVVDVEAAVRGAKHDFLAIQDSQIHGKDELLDDVIQAVAVLKPEALAYFKEHQPSKIR